MTWAPIKLLQPALVGHPGPEAKAAVNIMELASVETLLKFMSHNIGEEIRFIFPFYNQSQLTLPAHMLLP